MCPLALSTCEGKEITLSRSAKEQRSLEVRKCKGKIKRANNSIDSACFATLSGLLVKLLGLALKKRRRPRLSLKMFLAVLVLRKERLITN